MGKAAGTRLRERVRGFVFALIGTGFLFQSSCAELELAVNKAERALRQLKPSAPIQFQSDEYVVYSLQGGDSPAKLAERFLGDRKLSWIIEDANGGSKFRKNEIIVIPLKVRNRGGLTRNGYQIVPILSYHHFADNCKSNLCLPTRRFDQHMRYLKDNRYRVITMAELLGFLKYRHPIPKRSVVLTIDDGYRSAYDTAYPILKKYGYKATLFIYTDYIEASENSISWDQLREMKANGFEVGSHTLSHTDLTKKRPDESDQAYLERIKGELLLSKQIIDRELEQDTIYLAYPYGRYNETILKLSEDAGYKIGVTVKRGGNAFFADPLVLDRNQILKSDLNSFTAMIRTFNEFPLK